MNWKPKIIYNAITITFSFPPEGDPLKESIKTASKTSTSLTGLEQSSWFFNEETQSINFKFLTKTELDALRTFYKVWGSRGKVFDYYPSEDEVDFNTYTLKRKTFTPKRPFSDGAGDFFYDVTIQMRRVL